MTLKQADLWRGTAALSEGRVGGQSIWAVLYREGDRLFADELFADLFAEVGRRSVPPRIVATVMVLQRLRGLSDREAVEAFSFDARWNYAWRRLAFATPGFSHTVLVDMRRCWPPRPGLSGVFEVTVAAARRLGWSGCGGLDFGGPPTPHGDDPAVRLLAVVVGQDLEQAGDGSFGSPARSCPDDLHRRP